MRRRVLIVEDDHDLRRLFRTALTFAGFELQEAGDGLTALQWIDQEPPDLVVLDLMLPTLSGRAVQQEIAASAHLRHIPIVIVTGSGEPAEAACVLRKPVNPEQLVKAVRSCLPSGVPPAGA